MGARSLLQQAAALLINAVLLVEQGALPFAGAWRLCVNDVGEVIVEEEL